MYNNYDYMYMYAEILDLYIVSNDWLREDMNVCKHDGADDRYDWHGVMTTSRTCREATQSLLRRAQSHREATQSLLRRAVTQGSDTISAAAQVAAGLAHAALWENSKLINLAD